MAEINIDPHALEVARLAVENTLIEFRDSAMFMVGGNGFVVRNKDGSPSEIMRLSTAFGLQIGIKAYLEALAQGAVGAHDPLCFDKSGHPHDIECECWCHGGEGR